MSCFWDENSVYLLSDSLNEMTSFLSNNVYELLCKCSTTEHEIKVLTPEKDLDCKYLDNILKHKGDDFKDCVLKLAPALTNVKNVYAKMDINEFQDILFLLQWTKSEEVFCHCFKLLRENSNLTSVLLACLILTASIERALGDVFLLKGRAIPFLLKDLLATPELKEILGSSIIVILNVLMGSPSLLNIRNVLWHGFIAPSELLDSRYAFFLISLVLAIGKELNNKNITQNDIPYRSFITLGELDVLEKTFSNVDNDISEMKFIFEESSLIFAHMYPCWEMAITEYDKKRYNQSTVLLIPQLENCLRLIFAHANDSPAKVLTAEACSHYVTFTEIFAEKLENDSENMISNIITPNEMELLLDIFMHPEGPRFRDRLSHGEVNFFNIPQYLIKHIFCIAAILCMKFMKPTNQLLYRSYFCKLQCAVNHYHSFFHSSSFLKRRVCAFISTLEKWNSYQYSKECFEIKAESIHHPDKNMFCQCVRNALHFYNLNLPHQWSLFSDELKDFYNFIKNCKISTFHRPRIEGEIISILRKIVDNSIEISENIQHSLQKYSSLLEKRELRSRQRSTYQRLLNSVYILYDSLHLLLIWIICNTSFINNTSSWTTDEQFLHIRFLKMLLKYCENINSLTQIQANRYEEACAMCSKLLKQSADHCIFFK